MNLFFSINQNFRKGKYYIIIGLAIIALVLAATEFIHQYRGIPYEDLTRDPNAISLKPKYIGFVSQIGIFFWFGAVSICLLGSMLLKRLAGDGMNIQYLRFFCFFSFVLGVDDVFMLHDESAHRGVNEQVVYIIYMLSFGYFILKFWKLVFKTNFNLIFIAGFLLAASIFMDTFYSSDFIIEDGFKLSGIVFWFLYFLDTSISFITLAVKNRLS
ncbi:hypothetical protein [Sediminibacterium sp.]|uniref:hypothetical protein n=1 Tax=Sediminibacterium sp. TaxID=1917865 RepID=UPI002737435F|nr:hypothetical protein [Sediminibacterium sp.]MDP3394734.1 hypothetical protein [Sediminibacterium sp.]MDP3568569.1 hypothetical protein [Sediminibacterium sp.]